MFAMSKYNQKGSEAARTLRNGLFLCPAYNTGSLTPCLGYNGHVQALLKCLDNGKWAAVFLCPQV